MSQVSRVHISDYIIYHKTAVVSTNLYKQAEAVGDWARVFVHQLFWLHHEYFNNNQ